MPNPSGRGGFQERGCPAGPGRPVGGVAKPPRVNTASLKLAHQQIIDELPNLVEILLKLAKDPEEPNLGAIRMLLDRGFPVELASSSVLLSKIDELETLVAELTAQLDARDQIAA